MVIHKRKKVTKYRAHTTHGGGHRKKRRGAGSRGGRGRAGTGKRAGHKKAGGMVITGRKGFRARRTVKSIKAVNLGYFTQERLGKLVKAEKAVKEGDVYSLDLTKLGFNKLLGTGKLALKLKINVPYCSESAAEKVKAAGGEVVTAGAAPVEEKTEEVAEAEEKAEPEQ
jgi:large subunit ribosomal protein L15